MIPVIASFCTWYAEGRHLDSYSTLMPAHGMRLRNPFSFSRIWQAVVSKLWFFLTCWVVWNRVSGLGLLDFRILTNRSIKRVILSLTSYDSLHLRPEWWSFCFNLNDAMEILLCKAWLFFNVSFNQALVEFFGCPPSVKRCDGHIISSQSNLFYSSVPVSCFIS